MLLAREKKIVTLLIEHEDKLTTTQIATSLKVSSRTLKADIKKINEELEKHSCRINSQQGVGLWIEYDNHEAKKYLKEVTRDTADLYLSPEVRKYHLAVELLLQDDYTSMEVLAKEYYISKATVLNDLNELDELWEHYGVHFIKKVKYGIKVEGNESQIRSALLEALKRAGGRQKVTVSNIQSHFTSVELKDLREIIGQMEGRFQFILTDISVGELMLDLAVMLERLSAGKTMDHEGSIPGRESRRMDFVLGYLKEHLTESFGIEIPDTEDCYLRICLSGLRFHVPMEKEQSLKEKRERNPEMFDYMMDLLMECDRKFYLQLEEDDELINALMDHLECMVLRLHSKMYTYNPILDAIKKELFYEYEIASFFMSTVYLYRRYEAHRILECIEKNKITFMHGSPTVFGLLMDLKEEYPALPSLRMMLCGSSYMPVEKLKQLHKWLPTTEIRTVFGMTETASPGTLFPTDTALSIYPSSSGRPVPGLELKILDDDGHEVETGTVGTVYIRGANVVEYYYKMESPLFTEDGWLDTGDMGYQNEDAFVFFVDRKKDMVNRGGEKIWCTDVEDELIAFKGVKDAAVVGIPNEKYGEVAAAVVVLEKGAQLTEEQIKEEMLKEMARFKVPERILFLDAIPKTPGLKTDKKYIRTLFQ